MGRTAFPIPECPRLTREIDGFALLFEDDFHGDALDETRWLPCYLPHWIGTTRQSPDYPMQLMLNVYDLAGTGESEARFDVDYVRGWQRLDNEEVALDR